MVACGQALAVRAVGDQWLGQGGHAVAQPDPHPGEPVGAVPDTRVEATDLEQCLTARHDGLAVHAVRRRVVQEELRRRQEARQLGERSGQAVRPAFVVDQDGAPVHESRPCQLEHLDLRGEIPGQHQVVAGECDEELGGRLAQRPIEASVVVDVALVAREGDAAVVEEALCDRVGAVGREVVVDGDVQVDALLDEHAGEGVGEVAIAVAHRHGHGHGRQAHAALRTPAVARKSWSEPMTWSSIAAVMPG